MAWESGNAIEQLKAKLHRLRNWANQTSDEDPRHGFVQWEINLMDAIEKQICRSEAPHPATLKGALRRSLYHYAMVVKYVNEHGYDGSVKLSNLMSAASKGMNDAVAARQEEILQWQDEQRSGSSMLNKEAEEMMESIRAAEASEICDDEAVRRIVKAASQLRTVNIG